MKYIMTFSSGILLGFTAGLLIDKDNRKKIQEIAKNQGDRMKAFEQNLRSSIDKLKNTFEEKKASFAKK